MNGERSFFKEKLKISAIFFIWLPPYFAYGVSCAKFNIEWTPPAVVYHNLSCDLQLFYIW